MRTRPRRTMQKRIVFDETAQVYYKHVRETTLRSPGIYTARRRAHKNNKTESHRAETARQIPTHITETLKILHQKRTLNAVTLVGALLYPGSHSSALLLCLRSRGG